MPRIARVVIPGYPHHVTQRGNRRQPVFFTENDYRTYLKLMGEWCQKRGVDVWGYCLMPNHVHLILVPQDETSLRLAIGEAHRRYTLHVNFREGWKGHLWQERFSSFAMDERYLLAATRYIELNPVRAKLVKKPEDYRWSSARAHMRNKDDGFVNVSGVGQLIGNWNEFLSGDVGKEMDSGIQEHLSNGRPAGGAEFLKKLQADFKIPPKVLFKKKPGPQKGAKNASAVRYRDENTEVD